MMKAIYREASPWMLYDEGYLQHLKDLEEQPLIVPGVYDWQDIDAETGATLKLGAHSEDNDDANIGNGDTDTVGGCDAGAAGFALLALAAVFSAAARKRMR
jgi:hypothetical protein